MTNTIDQKRVLALDVRPRSFGYVVFEGPDRLPDWGVRSFRKGVNAVRVPLAMKIAALMEDFQPATVVSKEAPTRKKVNRAKSYRSSTIVADRLCGAVAEPIVRNAQEKRQLALIENYLTERGYKLKVHPATDQLTQMEPGTFCFRLNVLVKPSKAEMKTVKSQLMQSSSPKRLNCRTSPCLSKQNPPATSPMSTSVERKRPPKSIS